MATTAKGYRYPIGTDPNNVPADIQRLAEDVDAAPGIAVVTTTERDALLVWTGRTVYNTTTARHEVWNGAQWIAVVGSVSERRRKTADEAVAGSAALQNDDHLVIALGANETWIFEALIGHREPGASGTPDIKMGFVVPADAAIRWSIINRYDPASGAAAVFDAVTASGGSQSTASFGAATDSFLRGIVRMGPTAGNLQFQWAQNTAHANEVRVLMDSVLEARKM